MFKILNTQGLGVSGRQNELIELALTYKFNAVEVDMEDLVGRHDALGKEFACQFLQSAKISIGTFLLPIDIGAEDADYEKACKKLNTILDLATTLNGKRCYVPVEPSSKTPFQENFERHRTRLHELGEQFAKHGMRIGLALQSPSPNPKPHKFVQTAEEILTLIKTVGQPNVGLCLDTWQWAVSGGGLDQISDLKAEQVTELRMADIPEQVDLAKVTKSDRELPGNHQPSLSIAIFKHLQSVGYDGSVSVATNTSTFARANRDLIVSKISRRLNQIIAGEELKDDVIRLHVEKPAAVDDSGLDEGDDESGTDEADKQEAVTTD